MGVVLLAVIVALWLASIAYGAHAIRRARRVRLGVREKALLRRDAPERGDDTEGLSLRTFKERLTKRHAVLACLSAHLVLLLPAFRGLTPTVLLLDLAALGALLVLRVRERRRTKRVAVYFAETLATVSHGLNSGYSMQGCVQLAAKQEANTPHNVYRAIMRHIELGDPLETAVLKLSRVHKIYELSLLYVVVTVHAGTGGRLAHAINILHRSITQKRNLELKIKALSSEAKISSYVVSSLPLLIVGVVSLLSPSYFTPLFHTTLGRVIAAYCVISTVIGMLVVHKLADFDG